MKGDGANMFCENCGTAIETNEAFCSKCGQAVEATKAITSVKKVSNRHIGIIACGIVGFILIIVLLVTLGGSGQRNPERALRNFIVAAEQDDYSTAIGLSVFDLTDLIAIYARANGTSVRELNRELAELTGFNNFNALLNNVAREARDELRADFGRNFSISVDILEYTEFTTEEMNHHLENFERRVNNELRWMGLESYTLWDLTNLDNANAMIEYRVRITISGRNDYDSWRDTIRMVRIGRRWYALDQLIFHVF